jgi:RNA-metabolizing metallo-beta-lactamase
MRKNFLVEVSTKQSNVTGSENLLRFKDKFDQENLILVDCGMLQEISINTFSKENVDFNFDVKNIKGVFITHAHNDHVGKIPILIKTGYNGKIYMSKETALFVENVLLDNLKIHREEAKKMNKKPLYDEDDIEKILSLIEPVEYKKSYKISCNGINLEFEYYRNNHILGASSIWLRIGKRFEKVSFFFSGDYNKSNELLKKEVHLPKKAIKDKNINVVIESTYGATRRREENNFMDIYSSLIRGIVHERKKLIIAINALHKAQEVLYVIKEIRDQIGDEFIEEHGKEFPKVYLDGKLAIKHTYTYAGILKRNFKPSGLIEIYDDATRSEAIKNKNSIILATAGMMGNGPITEYLKRLLEDQNTKFIVVSYCAEGTVGRKLMEKVAYIENAREAGKKEYQIDKTINLFGKDILVNADVEKITSLSTHGRQEDLLDLLKNFKKKNISVILLNHGEEMTREKFKRVIEQELGIEENKIHLFDKRNRFIFSKHGLEKKIPIKEEEKQNEKERKEKKEKKIIKREHV